MRREEYEKLNAIEDEMWWFRGLHSNLVMSIRRLKRFKSPRPVLDAGCGTGGLARRLREAFPDDMIVGLDLDEDACLFARNKSGVLVCAASINSLPFKKDTFGAILSADVLCHSGVDETGSLAAFYGALADGGVLVLNLPAYEWMLSAHDRAVSNSRRYRAGEVVRLLRAAGFSEIRVTYWNTLLFPVMVIHRKFFAGKSGQSDVVSFAKPLNTILGLIMKIETMLLGNGLYLPFGGSILATATK